MVGGAAEGAILACHSPLEDKLQRLTGDSLAHGGPSATNLILFVAGGGRWRRLNFSSLQTSSPTNQTCHRDQLNLICTPPHQRTDPSNRNTTTEYRQSGRLAAAVSFHRVFLCWSSFPQVGWVVFENEVNYVPRYGPYPFRTTYHLPPRNLQATTRTQGYMHVGRLASHLAPTSTDTHSPFDHHPDHFGIEARA